MGTVYLAEEEELGRRVALKVLVGGTTSESAAEARERFRREARTMASVEHPNIVRVYRIGRCDDGRDFLAMEFVEGDTLAERIRARGGLSLEEAIGLTRQTAEALAAAWARGVVHRDIKPANLFLDRGGRIRVGDFGLALPVVVESDRRLTRDGTLLGTPSYSSPEQLRGEEVDFRSDLYSLGVVFFEMLTGRVPFSGGSPFEIAHRQLQEELPIPRLGVPPEIEDEVGELLRWMTAKEARRRPGSHGELLSALRRLELRLDAEGSRPTLVHSPAEDRRTPALRSLPEAPAAGPMVPQRVDRLRQVVAFAHRLRSHLERNPARPLACLVHGEEGQCHASLVERLVREQVERALAPRERGEILMRHLDWPVGESLGELQTYLVTDLFSRVDPGYRGVACDGRALVGLPRLGRASTVVLRHEIPAERLEGEGLTALRWYLDRFWGDLPARRGDPLFLVFFEVVYPRRRVGVSGWSERWIGRRLERRLVSLFAGTESGAPRLALERLDSVSIDDVKHWFRRHRICDTDKERHERAEGIFRSSRGSLLPTLPMEEVEYALRRIHADTLHRKGW